MKWYHTLFFAALAVFTTTSLAETEIERVHKSLQHVLPGLPRDAVRPSPVAGLYQVMIPPKMFYVSADGRFAIDGDVIDLLQQKNISTPVRDKMRISAIDALGENQMIIYDSAKQKYTVTVFTDIDCGYCRKLHSQIDEYNKAGIRVRYLFYPRAGIGSASYNKAVSVWCADDQRKALTLAKRGEAIAEKQCDNPVAKEYELAQQIGVRGTPAIITEEGQVIPGYVPPARLKVILEAQQTLQ